MNAVLTVRVCSETSRRLRAQARRAGTTPSRILRALLDRELGPTRADAPAIERTARWVGAVCSRRVPPGRDTREALATWRPDRRG